MQLTIGAKSSEKEQTLQQANTLQLPYVNFAKDRLPMDTTITVEKKDNSSWWHYYGKILSVVLAVFVLLCLQATNMEKRHRKELQALQDLKDEYDVKFAKLEAELQDMKPRLVEFDNARKGADELKELTKDLWENVLKDQVVVFMKNGGFQSPGRGFNAVTENMAKTFNKQMNTYTAKTLGVPLEVVEMFVDGIANAIPI